MDRVRRILFTKAAHDRGIYGNGIGVAVLDTGIIPHMDFITGQNRIAVFADFVNKRALPYDIAGHGTHVTGIIGGNGAASRGTFTGIAPKCHFAALRVLDENGDGNAEVVIDALDWVMANRERYSIRIVNLSFGSNLYQQEQVGKRLLETVERIWDNGLVVVAAAGNGGPRPGSITIPGSSHKVITVGGEETDVFSGQGPTSMCVMKPDVVAPAKQIVSCSARGMAAKSVRSKNYWSKYTAKSGTSMACPMVSGAVCLLLERFPQLTNKDVKIAIRDSCTDLGKPHSAQGWGRLNIRELLHL